nr:GtrA family protein [uncultured Novosphingobium sp.]
MTDIPQKNRPLDRPPLDRSALAREAATLARFVLVGLANTAIGYGLILGWLRAGLGDYAANLAGFAMGLPISYALHRHLTFRARHRASTAEALRYGAAFLVSYAANLGVIALGRAAGFERSALVQGLAICTYAGVLFVLTRITVFRAQPARSLRES